MAKTNNLFTQFSFCICLCMFYALFTKRQNECRRPCTAWHAGKLPAYCFSFLHYMLRFVNRALECLHSTVYYFTVYRYTVYLIVKIKNFELVLDKYLYISIKENKNEIIIILLPYFYFLFFSEYLLFNTRLNIVQKVSLLKFININ